MPTYEYQCDACAHQFEEMQSFSDNALTKCPKCKKKKLRRLFGTGAAVLFKGAGFYQTDYRTESYKSAEKKDSEAAKPAATSDGAATKSENGKPAKSAEPAKKAGSGKTVD